MIFSDTIEGERSKRGYSTPLVLFAALFFTLPAWAQEVETPMIIAEPLPITNKAKPRPDALPKRSRARLPGFNGDSFFVMLEGETAGPMKAEQVLSDVVRPVLSAVGFDQLPELGLPQPMGSELPIPLLPDLARQVCREFDRKTDPRNRSLCDAFSTGKADDHVQRTISDAYNQSFATLKTELSRPRIQYVYRQLVNGVPIEHSAVVATRRAGETVTKVRGTVLKDYSIGNKLALDVAAAIALGQHELVKLKLSQDVSFLESKSDPPTLVLLPYGGIRQNGRDIPTLRYAYRAELYGKSAINGQKIEAQSWLTWIDAEKGTILQLIPQFGAAAVDANGKMWRLSPSTEGSDDSILGAFQVDSPADGECKLQLTGIFDRINRIGGTFDGFDDGEVAVPPENEAESALVCNFDQPPVNDPARAICDSTDINDHAFRQINAFAHLFSYWKIVTSAGTIPSFPTSPITVWVDNDNGPSFAGLRLRFPKGSGFSASDCPDASSGLLNGAQDASVLVHEIGHLSTKRMQEGRPANWCGATSCPKPISWRFHDFADAIANAYSSTPCLGGWLGKNEGGTDTSKDCLGKSSNSGGLPRLALADSIPPFSPSEIDDLFPKARTNNQRVDAYIDGQVITAALWLVREGLRSKSPVIGSMQFWIRLNSAIWDSGLSLNSCVRCERDVYRASQEVLTEFLSHQILSEDPESSNKIASAFARAGLFATPYQCIDSDPTTLDLNYCPDGESGGDAIIDLTDNDPMDDLVSGNVSHRESDYVKRTGNAPSFRLWTGPIYEFDSSGSASNFQPSSANGSPCNVAYQVELSDDSAFGNNLLTSSLPDGTWLTVSNDSPGGCTAVWTPSEDDPLWRALVGSSGEKRIYYRLRTRNGTGAEERVSTELGAGLFAVPAPYFIVNDSGTF